MFPPRLIVFSGAGISAESGLATFRGASGLWEGVSIRTVCDITTWEDNFDAMHDFYDARRVSGAKAEPNLAHRTIAEWEKAWPGRVVILTQNIDRLLESAGCTNVIKLHGDIRLLRCFDCGHQWELEGLHYDRKGCPACASTRVKPGVVFFGEAAPRYDDLYSIVSGTSRSRHSGRRRHLRHSPSRRPSLRQLARPLHPREPRAQPTNERAPLHRAPLRPRHAGIAKTHPSPPRTHALSLKRQQILHHLFLQAPQAI